MSNSYSSLIYAQYASSIVADGIPEDVRDLLKYILLDSIGTGIAASTLGEGCREALGYATSQLGSGDAPLLGMGASASPIAAAFVNGALVHALNFDAGGHAHVGAIVPAALAAVSAAVTPVSGNDFLCGLLAGMELIARIAQSARKSDPSIPRSRVLEGQLHGYFGCAAASGRILGLSPERLHDAFGLALMQATGTMQVVIDGDPPAKAIYAGFANQGGLQAALLAQQGLGANCDVFDGPAGLFQLFYQSDCRFSAIYELGTQFYLRLVRFKPWPTSGILHPLMKAALELHDQHHPPLDAIASITIHADKAHRSWFEPSEMRAAPTNGAMAANSGQFIIAKLFANGRLGLEDFTPSALQDADAIAVAQRITVVFWDRDDETISLKLKSGESFEARAVPADRLSHALAATSEELIRQKFADCIRFAQDPALIDRGAAIVDLVAALETVDDMKRLTGLLLKPQRPSRRSVHQRAMSAS